MEKLLFGTAGIPISTERISSHNTINGIKREKELGLGCMELEFVRSVNISEKLALEVKKAAQENGIILTCHGQYYINLNSLEEKKIQDSIQRILNAARIANLCGAFSMCFHPAYYHNIEPEKVYEKVKNQFKCIIKKLKDEGNSIWVRPETTGKQSQFGTLQEIVRLSEEVEQVMPCIDFAHLHAREGKINTKKEFFDALALVEKKLGTKALKNMHIHMAGIEYGQKGELNHANLQDKESDFNYKELLKVWKEFKIAGAVISESPNIEQDALLMQKLYY